MHVQILAAKEFANMCLTSAKMTIAGIDLEKKLDNEKEHEFGIELETAGKERLNTMCNLGEGIREMALEEGIEKGKVLGIIETCMKLNMPKEDMIEKLKEIMKVSDEVARKYYEEAAMQVV